MLISIVVTQCALEYGKSLKTWLLVLCGCGEFTGEVKLVSLSQCNNDITAHLRRCHLAKENITESELILQRAGYLDKTAQQAEKMFVCPRHRANLGKDWGNPTGRTACRYPDHKGKQTCVKSDIGVTVKITREVMGGFGVAISYWIT